MAELPILPLKTDALLADTTHMSAEEFGAYCRILFVMWRHRARLKDDDTEMAAIAGMPLARWRKIKERVTRPMTLIEGTYSQKRLTDTWMQVQEIRRKRAHAAGMRWHMQKQSKCNANQNQKIDSSLSEERESGEAGMHVQVTPELTAALRRKK
jgi:uncharacterized protein YdaU (DUF1376 family)